MRLLSIEMCVRLMRTSHVAILDPWKNRRTTMGKIRTVRRTRFAKCELESWGAIDHKGHVTDFGRDLLAAYDAAAKRQTVSMLIDSLADRVAKGTAKANYRVEVQPDGSEIWMIVAAVVPGPTADGRR